MNMAEMLFMKKIILILVLLIGLISACTNQSIEQPQDDTGGGSTIPVQDNVVPQKEETNTIVAVPEAKQKIALVDKNKYLVGGKEMAETAEVHFLQEKGTGFEATVDAGDKNIEIEAMTDADCFALYQGKEYISMAKDSGTQASLAITEAAAEDINICIKIKALDEGEITAHVTVQELVF